MSENIFNHPFPVSGNLESITKNSYTTQQTEIQKIAYLLSGSIFSYSTESFNLDSSISLWTKFAQNNIHGFVPTLTHLQTRSGAASILLGYSRHHDKQEALEATPIAKTVIASTATLGAMKPVLNQYVINPSKSSPLTFDIAAIDYDAQSGSLVTDYASALETVNDLGLGLIASHTLQDGPAVSILSTALSSVLPTAHIYGGIRAIQENSKTEQTLTSLEVADAFPKLAAVVKSDASLTENIQDLFAAANAEFGLKLAPFEYTGSARPQIVIVTFGSTESVLASHIVKRLGQSGQDVGTIAVRLYSPFLDEEFFKVLPESTKKLIVLGQVKDEESVSSDFTHSPLYLDISTALYMKKGLSSLKVEDHKYSRSKIWSEQEFYSLFSSSSIPSSRADIKEVVFWDTDDSSIIDTPARITHTISLDGSSSVSHFTKFDNEATGGVIETQLKISNTSTINAPYPVENADLVLINNSKVTSEFDVLKNVKPGAKAIISSSPDIEEINKNYDDNFKRQAAAKEIFLFAVNFDAIGDEAETQGRTQSMVYQIAFWKAFSPELTVNQITTKIVTANGVDTELVAATVARLVEKVVETAFFTIEIPKEWSEIETEASVQPPSINRISFLPNEPLSEEEVEAKPKSSTNWVEAAKQLVFSEAYDASTELRPDLPVKNFIVKVKENKRVTPAEYERHIFHFELDITGTGLKYDIGEALGVHARNNAEQVEDFLTAYGIELDSVVSVPSRDNSEIYETRTAYQAFRDNLDIFGKPPKKFFESLATYAKDEKEKAHLEKLAGAEGAEELKKRAEVDFDTYADILLEFKSAHLTLGELVELVAPLKRREYSIASSQHMHPNEVHLLIVVVDWVDSRGRKRYGQCSKYLSELPVGSELVVSVKPSVMKLPPTPQQPIIMSGLGTGLAPFKALIEEKVWQKEQGMEIGEIYLYLGSRHQREEYLYGEIWEAYKDAGIITHIGAAFSRDQPQKIYIQDKIRSSIDQLVSAFVDKKGYFYLCGPTWPVPDITACLEDILKKDAAAKNIKIDTTKEIEELKEAGRYVLEVY